MRFRHSQVRLAAPLDSRILDIQPVASLDQNVWVALTQTGQIISLNLDDELVTVLCEVLGSDVDMATDVSLTLSADGRMVAVVNTRGRHGAVFDLGNGKQTMKLDRGDYHEDVCNFPVAFFENQGRLLLIHGTDWNRLDISDPLTCTLLTDRSPTSYQQGEEEPEHYLDYFHCGLTVSPGAEFVADNGWVWHPDGCVVTWSLSQWLYNNIWESEDGSSKQDLCSRGYLWDGPLCWIDSDRLAVWGYGREDESLIPAVRIFKAVSGKEERWFAGPKGQLVFDQFLFSLDKDEGTSVWDAETGERLLVDHSFFPLRYHPGMKAFMTLLPDGGFQCSRLRGRSVRPEILSWNHGSVVRLAQAIQENLAFDRLGILGDALEDAGCTDVEILSHCRQSMPHAKSCWVIDMLLQS